MHLYQNIVTTYLNEVLTHVTTHKKHFTTRAITYKNCMFIIMTKKFFFFVNNTFLNLITCKYMSNTKTANFCSPFNSLTVTQKRIKLAQLSKGHYFKCNNFLPLQLKTYFIIHFQCHEQSE